MPAIRRLQSRKHPRRVAPRLRHSTPEPRPEQGGRTSSPLCARSTAMVADAVQAMHVGGSARETIRKSVTAIALTLSQASRRTRRATVCRCRTGSRSCGAQVRLEAEA